MGIDLSRLRAGEIVAGGAAVLLAVFMFALPWYGAAGTHFDGWQALSHLRWLLVVTIVLALALTFFQAACRAPAIPVSLGVLVTVLGLLSTLALIYRVLINVPGPDSILGTKVGAYLGLVSAIGILVGAFASLRQEGIAPKDGPGRIETLRSPAVDGS